jgi:tRNA 2-thiouridine synthesizing protein E
MSVQIDNERDNEGYLLDPDQWSVQLAETIAAEENIDLQDDHWSVINFVRDYYAENYSVPQARYALKHMKQTLDDDKATRKYLYYLFPYGYGQQACKIAGMRKPLKLMLDV